jgi:hypothetical protein
VLSATAELSEATEDEEDACSLTSSAALSDPQAANPKEANPSNANVFKLLIK